MPKAEIATIEPAQSSLITPPEMLNQAITSGASIEVMERLMTMNERWEATQARKAFDNAMAELRQNMPTVIKSQTVDFTTTKGNTNYKYEDLSAVTETLSPVLAGLGLSFRWRTESGTGNVSVTCIISHRDGHSEETTLTAGLDNSGGKNSIQALGSAVTYLQRYTLKAAVGIAAAHDDDAQSVSRKQPEKATSKAESRDYFKECSEFINSSATIQDLQLVWEKTIDWAKIPDDGKNQLVNQKDDRLREIKEAPTTKQSASDTLADQFPGDIPSEAQQAAGNLRAG